MPLEKQSPKNKSRHKKKEEASSDKLLARRLGDTLANNSLGNARLIHEHEDEPDAFGLRQHQLPEVMSSPGSGCRPQTGLGPGPCLDTSYSCKWPPLVSSCRRPSVSLAKQIMEKEEEGSPCNRAYFSEIEKCVSGMKNHG